MAKINLLPWREERREQQRQEFFVMLGVAAGVAVLVAAIFHVLLSSAISAQNDRNEYLKRNIADLDKKLVEIRELGKRRSELIDRMKVIQDLQGNRPVIVRVFDELVRTMPEGVYYRSVSRSGNTISIAGTAESNNRVSSLMRKLDASDWFANPQLKGVRENEKLGEQGNDFDLSVTVTMPTAANTGGQ